MVRVTPSARRTCAHIDLASTATTTAQILSGPIIRAAASEQTHEERSKVFALVKWGASCPMVQVMQGLYQAVHNV